jgi:hypothetical protein
LTRGRPSFGSPVPVVARRRCPNPIPREGLRRRAMRHWTLEKEGDIALPGSAVASGAVCWDAARLALTASQPPGCRRSEDGHLKKQGLAGKGAPAGGRCNAPGIGLGYRSMGLALFRATEYSVELVRRSCKLLVCNDQVPTCARSPEGEHSRQRSHCQDICIQRYTPCSVVREGSLEERPRYTMWELYGAWMEGCLNWDP